MARAEASSPIWTELSFGKHRGKTLPQVLFTDPDWFFWAMEEGVFNNRRALAKEADLLNDRATRIKIPKIKHKKPVVEYLIHPSTKKFSHFHIVPSDRELHHGSSPAFRLPVIDMSVPRRIGSYDKLGCKKKKKGVRPESVLWGLFGV